MTLPHIDWESLICEARNTYVERGQFDFDGHCAAFIRERWQDFTPVAHHAAGQLDCVNQREAEGETNNRTTP
jgi:hypothetical protein